MKYDWDTIGEDGLHFFGTVSASISHEIKNVLAILNENAGLMEDLVSMAEKGISLNNERLKSIAVSMKKQIQRGDLIAKNMNRFAHSVDDFLITVDVSETLELVVSLSGRSADMRGVRLNPQYIPRKICISTHPFFLETLLWRCLNVAITFSGKEKTVGIMIEEMGKGARVSFSGLNNLSALLPDEFPSKRENALRDALCADIGMDVTCGQIWVNLPEKIGA